MKAWMKVNYTAFYRNLENQTRDVKNKVSQETNRASLRVERRAKKYAPWDTGYMSMTIYSYMENTLSAVIISPAYYSIFVELGTRYMSAQPFIYPALQEEKPIYFANLARIVGG